LDLDIIIAPEPKEITAKGLLYDTGVSQAEILKLKEILPGDNSNKMIEQNSPINNLKYAEIENDELIKQGVIDNVLEFHKLFNKLSIQLNFKGETGMTAISFELYEKIYKKDLNHFLVQGMKDAIKESEDKNST